MDFRYEILNWLNCICIYKEIHLLKILCFSALFHLKDSHLTGVCNLCTDLSLPNCSVNLRSSHDFCHPSSVILSSDTLFVCLFTLAILEVLPKFQKCYSCQLQSGQTVIWSSVWRPRGAQLLIHDSHLVTTVSHSNIK